MSKAGRGAVGRWTQRSSCSGDCSLTLPWTCSQHRSPWWAHSPLCVRAHSECLCVCLIMLLLHYPAQPCPVWHSSEHKLCYLRRQQLRGGHTQPCPHWEASCQRGELPLLQLSLTGSAFFFFKEEKSEHISKLAQIPTAWNSYNARGKRANKMLPLSLSPLALNNIRKGTDIQRTGWNSPALSVAVREENKGHKLWVKLNGFWPAWNKPTVLCVKTWERLLVMAFKSFQCSQHFSSLLNLLGLGKSIFSFNCWFRLTTNYVESIKTEGVFFILIS